MIRTISSLLIALCGAVGLLLLPAPSASAADGDVWAVDDMQGKKKDDVAENVSGIACATDIGFPRNCLLIDDETQGAQWVTVTDGKIAAGKYERLITNTFGPEQKKVELDGEAVAMHAGKFYVAGSHGHPRDSNNKLDDKKDAEEISARISANSQLFEIVSGSAPKPTQNLAKLFEAQKDLKPYINIRLQANGLNLEGLAIWDNAGKTELLAGLRGPLIESKAIVVGAELNKLFNGPPDEARLIKLDLDGRGIRDLVRYGNGFLIIGGPSGDEDGVYAIYRWDGTSTRPTLAKTLPEIRGKKKNKQRKPEALLPLDAPADNARVLVMFDGEDNGGPRVYALERP